MTTVLGTYDLMLLDDNKKQIKNNILQIIESIENHLKLQDCNDKATFYINNYRQHSRTGNFLKCSEHKKE